jgi:hypothetical protein
MGGHFLLTRETSLFGQALSTYISSSLTLSKQQLNRRLMSHLDGAVTGPHARPTNPGQQSWPHRHLPTSTNDVVKPQCAALTSSASSRTT